MNSELTHDIRHRRNVWFWSGIIWQIVHYSLGLLAVISTAVLGKVDPDPRTGIGLTIATTICIAVVSFLNPAKLGSGYINAWRLLDSAVRRYDAGNEQKTLEQINAAIDHGERMIATNEPIGINRE